MSKKLFVGGLSWDTADESLRAAFEAYGPVREARVILDRETGRSRGFGFVTFDDPVAGDEAIAKMNGAMLDGRTIRVNEAEERRGGPSPGGPRRDDRGPRRDDRGPPRRGYAGPGGPEVHTRGRPPAPPRGAPRSGPPSFDPGSPPAFAGAAESGGWEEDRGRRDPNKKRKKRPVAPQREEDFRPRTAARKGRRESGRSWRDYDLDEEAGAEAEAEIGSDESDFEFG